MANDQNSIYSSPNKFNSGALTDSETLPKSVPNSAAGTESDIASSGVKTSRPQSERSNNQADSQTSQEAQGEHISGDHALDVLRTSLIAVFDSVVREYEPQIATFTSNLAHQAVDRSVELAQSFAQTAVTRVKNRSWVRLGLAAALGIGIIAVLSYEAADSTDANGATPKPLH